MASYAGAVAAMRARFEELWADTTPISFPNETPPVDPWPPQVNGEPVPWVYFEVIGTGSNIRGAGLRGDNVWLYEGGIYIHVFVPEGYGIADAHALADQAGEIFRAATFYMDGVGSKVLSMSPQTDGGSSDADNGNQFRVTCYIPFEFFHRG